MQVSWGGAFVGSAYYISCHLFMTQLTLNLIWVDMHATEDATAAEEFEDDFM